MFTVKDASTDLQVSFPVANNSIGALQEKGIVGMAGEGRCNRLFRATAVLDAFDRIRLPKPETTALGI